MIKDIWERNALPSPPANLDADLFEWLRLAQSRQDVSFVDFTPLPQDDIERLKRSLGEPPEELLVFYHYVTPWWDMRNGFDVWDEHMKIAFNQFKRAAVKKEEYDTDELDQIIADSPPIWPVSLSKEATVLAFSDDMGRLAIMGGNIGAGLGHPLAVGLRNYIVMMVVADIRWDERNYPSYEHVLRDSIVRQAGKWPEDSPPRHFLIDAYENDLWNP